MLQPVRAQITASEMFRIAPRDRATQRWMTRQFLEKTPGWMRIWQRSLAMGGSLEPFLEHGLREPDPSRRLVWIGAYVLAARRGDVVFLGKAIRSQKKQDRFLSLFGHALGPRQTGDASAILEKAVGESDLECIAAFMAAARCLERPVAPAAYEKSTAVGVLAAAMLYRPDRRVAWLEQRLRSVGDTEFHHLVWRAYLLGEPCLDAVEGDRRQLALDVLRKRKGAPPVGDAAAYFVARSPQAAGALGVSELDGLPLRQRLVLAHSPTLRRHLLRQEPVLRTEPEVLQRRWVRFQIEYGDVAQVRQSLQSWLRLKAFEDKEHRSALGFALVSRLLRMPHLEASKAQWKLDAIGIPEVTEWAAIALAETHGGAHQGSPARRRLGQLLASEKLTRGEVAVHLNRAAWGGGAHPAYTALELHRQLLGELLIDGSRIGATSFAKSPRKPYIAEGFQRDDQLFQVAAELFKFVRRAEPWSMPECRFPN